MPLKGLRCEKPIQLLTQKEMDEIHEKSLEILEKTGVVFLWQAAIDLLEEAGCVVETEKKRVEIPRSVVEESLRSCARNFSFKARVPENDLEFSPDNIYFTIQHASKMYDLDSGQKRSATVKDLEQIVTIADALENIHSVNAPIQVIEDRSPHVYNEWTLATAIRNSTKLPVGSGFNFGAIWHIEIAKAAGVELPGEFTSTSPLMYAPDQCDGIIQFAQAGWGMMLMSGAIGGATSPATIAGTLLQQNVEILAGIVLAQAANPGIGCNYGIQSKLMDMRYGQLAYGIEMYMIVAAGAQMARYYGLTSSSYDCFSGGKYPSDQQVGYEKGMAALILGQAGVTYNFAAGGIDDEACFSIEQLIIDDEMYSMVGRFLDGIEVSEKTLASDLIHKVASERGTFLDQIHTRDFWKDEQFLPSLSYRLTLEQWIRDGSKDVAARAKEKAFQILEIHEVPPLPVEADREIANILETAERVKGEKSP